MPRRSNKQIARDENRRINAMLDNRGGDVAAKRTTVRKWHIRAFLDSVDRCLNENGIRIPVAFAQKVGPGAAAIFSRIFEIAIRDNSEDPRIYCPRCKRYHNVPTTAACPEHPEEFPALEAKVNNVLLEKNSLQASTKLLDKFLPTLSSVDNNINIQGQITTVSAHLTTILFKYVPAADRKTCFEEINEFLTAIQHDEQGEPGEIKPE